MFSSEQFPPLVCALLERKKIHFKTQTHPLTSGGAQTPEVSRCSRCAGGQAGGQTDEQTVGLDGDRGDVCQMYLVTNCQRTIGEELVSSDWFLSFWSCAGDPSLSQPNSRPNCTVVQRPLAQGSPPLRSLLPSKLLATINCVKIWVEVRFTCVGTQAGDFLDSTSDL